MVLAMHAMIYWMRTMTPEQVLSHEPRALSQDQREHYFEAGYLLVPSLVPDDRLQELNEVTAAFLDRSRSVTESDATFDVAPGHCADRPRLRRLKRPDGQHEAYWRFVTEFLADVAADLLGPDVKFHHAKLNFKWSDAAVQIAVQNERAVLDFDEHGQLIRLSAPGDTNIDYRYGQGGFRETTTV